MVRALGDYVLLQHNQPEDGMGIILSTEYVVASVGDTVPIILEIGDKVMFDTGNIIDSAFKELVVINYKDILAVK